MELQEKHNSAMLLADKADALRRQGKKSEADTLYRQSLEAERQAALLAREQAFGEPTESVLFRSAASLAYSINDYREAERLICLGLAGNPPAEIADELRSLYDSVNLDRSIGKLKQLKPETERENVTLTIPVGERSLLNVLVRKFGRACAF